MAKRLILNDKVVAMMTAVDAETMNAIANLMNNGIAPSQADRILGRKPGTVHDAMVEYWEIDHYLFGRGKMKEEDHG